jgi:pyridoxine 5'-phosphate synthase PdxJ
LVTKTGKDFVLTHDNRKLRKTTKPELIAKAILSDKSGPLVAIHPKADKKLLRSWGLSPEIVLR